MQACRVPPDPPPLSLHEKERGFARLASCTSDRQRACRGEKGGTYTIVRRGKKNRCAAAIGDVFRGPWLWPRRPGPESWARAYIHTHTRENLWHTHACQHTRMSVSNVTHYVVLAASRLRPHGCPHGRLGKLCSRKEVPGSFMVFSIFFGNSKLPAPPCVCVSVLGCVSYVSFSDSLKNSRKARVGG